ncbi:membrane-bound lytic transglycosylase F [compost metagenome]
MLGIRDWVRRLTVHSSARSALIFNSVAALAFTLFTGPLHAATEAMAAPESPEREQLTLSTDSAMKPWSGDLDGMIERRVIRVLTVYSKTFYFVDRGVQRGTTYDFFRVFEEDLNKKLVKDKKLKHKALKVRVMLIPVARDELLPALLAGKGDIAASNLTVTEERRHLVDFTSPVYRNVSEVVVSGPDSPAVSSKPAVILKEAPEALEDEDLIEMLNAGMVPLIVVDKHKADFWKKVFPAITVHDDVVTQMALAASRELSVSTPLSTHPHVCLN